ncbi:MAG: rhodanese-like domain-containing protein [Bacteroidetes bacterium]|nr:rhodanese-like domain-containing protein [Bacteroidota bacterium]
MNKFLILVFSISTFFGCKGQPNNVMVKVDVTTFKEALVSNSDIQLVDVRTPKEYNDGHIENAKLIDFLSEDFKIKIQELEKEKPIYLYCRSGRRSGKASKILTDLGFAEIVDLKGGYLAWSEQ